MKSLSNRKSSEYESGKIVLLSGYADESIYNKECDLVIEYFIEGSLITIRNINSNLCVLEDWKRMLKNQLISMTNSPLSTNNYEEGNISNIGTLKI